MSTLITLQVYSAADCTMCACLISSFSQAACCNMQAEEIFQCSYQLYLKIREDVIIKRELRTENEQLKDVNNEQQNEIVKLRRMVADLSK